MRNILCVVLLFVSGAAYAQSMSAEEIARAQKIAEQVKNDPQFQEKLKEMQQQMQQQDTSANGASQPMPTAAMSGQNMEGVIGMSQCFKENVTEAGINKITASGQKLNAEIRALCAAGKKSEAEHVAVKYGIEMMASREYLAIKQCSEKYKEAFNSPVFKGLQDQVKQMEGKPSGPKRGVCDEAGASSN